METVRLFSSSKGLNTKIQKTRVAYDEGGAVELTKAVNVSHDYTGRVSRRSGYEVIADGDFHSLFCDGGDCFVGRSRDLYKVNPDRTLTGVRGELSGDRISFCQVGDETYYTNGAQNGVIRNGTSYPWPVGEYEGPVTTRSFSGSPVGTHLAYYNGYMCVSVGPVVYFSEPWAPGLFNMSKMFVQFSSDVRMVKPVASGIFVSDEHDTWFFQGPVPEDFVQKKALNYPALEWSEATDYVDGVDIGLEFPGLCAMWGSRYGAVLGLPDGSALNRSINKIRYPRVGTQGSGLVKDQTFIFNMFF